MPIQIQLLLRDIGFPLANVDMAIDSFNRNFGMLCQTDHDGMLCKVLLFSGHMIDAPGRKIPRFPPEKEAVAAENIAKALDDLGAGPGDMAFMQGACGGDLLFAEACLKRGIEVHWLQPFREPEFVENSVAHGGNAWLKRYQEARRQVASVHWAPDELGALPEATDPYERCNLWLLFTALACGGDKVSFICLWNGEGGEGPGGTAHMYNEAKKRMENVIWIDIGEI